MANKAAFTYQGFTADQGDHAACKDEVACLERRGGAARVRKTYAGAPGKEVVLPGSVSNRLFRVMGLMQMPFNSACIMHEMRSAFGWNQQHPLSSFRVLQRDGKSMMSDDSEGKWDKASATTLSLEVTREIRKPTGLDIMRQLEGAQGRGQQKKHVHLCVPRLHWKNYPS